MFPVHDIVALPVGVKTHLYASLEPEITVLPVPRRYNLPLALLVIPAVPVQVDHERAFVEYSSVPSQCFALSPTLRVNELPSLDLNETHMSSAEYGT